MREKSNHLSALLASTAAIRMRRSQYTTARPDCRGGHCTLQPTLCARPGTSPSHLLVSTATSASHPSLLEAPEIEEGTQNATPTRSYLNALEINRAFL